LVLWARESDNVPLKINYFDENDFNHKTLALSDISIIEGVPTPMKMVMTDNRERTSTTMETLKITYAWEPPKDFFSERTLRK
jgi:hypothetical protein